MGARQPYRQLLADMRAAVAGRDAGADPLVDRAAAMLAGRVGCRVREARTHLERLADEEGLEVTEVAANLVGLLESQAGPAATGGVRAVVDRAIRATVDPLPSLGGLAAPGPAAVGPGAAAPLIQQILDALPGAYAWLLPVRDDDGRVTDYLMRAVSPAATDVHGRRGAELVGVTVRQAYPATDPELFQRYEETLADGTPRQFGPMRYREAPGDPQTSYSVRVHAAAGGLLIGWVRQDEAGRLDDRIAQTERLASLGWGEWDLLTGQISWSDELYRIYERDPALGPLSQEESNALILADDQHVRAVAAEALAAGERADISYRISVGDHVKHLRAIIDAVRDAAGRPLRLYGIVQDITSREIARARLASVERELREHQQTLRAEHRLAAQLQQIVLPIPAAPIDLPGLRVAVRYLPAERASRVGGDWYHATSGPDGRLLLAVGDVAGHGLQAATTMAQLRHALAALAITTTTDPAELLSHLNVLLCRSESSAGTATAVVARYDPAAGVLTWAQAGHPAPLRARAGATTSLRRPAGPLLGAVPEARYEHATVELRQDDLLLFYTDGLVEDRNRSFEEGLAPVVDTLDDITRGAGPSPLADLLERLHRANPDDDTCLLAARRNDDVVIDRG